MADKKVVIAPLKERLKKLYEVGKLVTFTDEAGDFSIWLQKISPIQDKEAGRASLAPRAKVLALLKEKDNPERLMYDDLLESWGLSDRDSRIRFIISPEIQKAQLTAEAQVAAEKDWSENDYLDSLQEAWNSGLRERYSEDPNDEEACKVYDILLRYTEQVEKLVNKEIEELSEAYASRDDGYIKDKLIDLLIEHRAGQEQLAEYNQWLVYYAARNHENNDEFFFDNKDEPLELGKELYARLLEEYNEMTIDPIEGKDQPAILTFQRRSPQLNRLEPVILFGLKMYPMRISLWSF